MIRLLRLWFGTVTFSVSGGYARRFLYECISSGIVLWDITEQDGDYRCCVRAAAYRECAVLAGKHRVRIRIVRKKGLPFWKHRYRRRLGLAVGFVLFGVLLFVLSGYVWNIEITGNSQLTNTEILDALRRQGVCVGMPKSDLDVDTVSNRLFTELDELSWVFINRRGTTLYVELRERVYQPELFPRYSPANIVAAYTAQILRVDTYYGLAKVKPGQTVTEGELLVSGVWEDREGAWKLVHADAVVWAAARVVKQVRVEYEQQVRTVSESAVRRYELGLFGLTVPLYLNLPEQGTDRSETLMPLRLFGTQLPVYLRRIEFHEVSEQTVILSRGEAEEKAYARLSELEREEMRGSVIRERKTAVTADDSGLTLTAVYEAEMDIAREQEITWKQSLP